MKLVVGLGNPGPQYETTRHNAGFLAIDRLVDVHQARGPEKDSNGEVFHATIAGEKALLIKPLTFMNLSGKCVGPIFKFYKCKPEDLIVIHDDLDLPALSVRVKTGGGAGGHNGLKSIDEALGSGNTGYHRIRVGIGRPAPGSPINTVDWVLMQFEDPELQSLDRSLDDVVQITRLLVEGNASKAMTDFNRKERRDSAK